MRTISPENELYKIDKNKYRKLCKVREIKILPKNY